MIQQERTTERCVFTNINSDWVQQGSTIYGTYGGGGGGYLGANYNTAIAMSGDGTKIFAGGNGADVNGTKSGYVQAWQWSKKAYTKPLLDTNNQTMTFWGGAEHNVNNYSVTQLGSTITGASSGVGLGSGMDMDSTGTILAVSDKYNTRVGSVRVYKYISGMWGQQGSTLYGTYNEDDFGFGPALSLSGNGKVLIVGALASGGFYTSGGTRVYGWQCISLCQWRLGIIWRNYRL